MLDSPETPRSEILSDTTNVRESLHFYASQLPTPVTSLDDGKPKRRISQSDETPAKRPRLMTGESSKDTINVDVEVDDVAAVKRRGCRRVAFRTLGLDSNGYPTGSHRMFLPSRNILQSFVSSNTSDVFKCHSRTVDSFVTPPYACAYSNGAKRDGVPLLAVATEQGSINILDTTKRREWDCEPVRVTMEPHENGIFDVKWNADDTLLATASGDKSTRISSVETQQLLSILDGHTSTVKCVAWDPTHRDLLTTGGRDGMLCLYDLRVNNLSDEDEIPARTPVITITAAHGQDKAPGGRQRIRPLPRGVTNILYPDDRPHGLVSSGSFDGILHYWDLRLPSDKPSKRSPKKPSFKPLFSSTIDPTTFHGARCRGITSMSQGSGPSAGLLFALGADSRLYTYSYPTLTPHRTETHPNLQTNSFYVRLATSPCGRWLASGSTSRAGSLFLFDINNAGRIAASYGMGADEPVSPAVRFRGQASEIGAIDWARNMVASCADDGTVRIWRPDLEVYQNCVANPEEQKWEWLWST
ncbi:WD40-repeat-containing domain protein [Suillus paluster]|uniref:WD40-repeat-containing domain protein n=1 Tax=Suillus paluster TaxID=48578 RepID=UPI001B881495|nr:WD40-repeat-containing domain protein [Suillus paluster]KAG1753781.1 WD40-repeat-containing domain protein [Suillus paluster]